MENIMKKLTCAFLAIFMVTFLNAQTNITVDVYDEIYNVIEIAQMKGLCKPLPGAKPYTEKKILNVLDEILQNSEKLSEKELKVINNYIQKCDRKNEENRQKIGTILFENNDLSTPMTFRINYGLNMNVSGGMYNNSDYSSAGFDFIPNFGFSGDIGNSLGYNIQGKVVISKMPLHLDGTDYEIGKKWYNAREDRNIVTYSNNNYLPFSYKKPWAGQFYWLSNMSASGLEGWAHEIGLSGNIDADIHASLLDDRINIGFARVNREWASMDTHSSLVLNGSAVPFIGIDMTFEILPFITYSSLTGTLEYPNRDDILNSSLPGTHTDDAAYFQNAFSINMVEVNVKGLHLDFGSSVIWPKRFELGYIFPLINYVEYQNHIGDFDNLGLFGDIKYTKEELGSVWASLYLDEINGLNNNPIKYTRAMFATQAGIKALIPNVPFGTLALRYTKIEPYCYTHHSINYVPYYADYVSENYTNNGICLGSYLPPNSDEIMVRFDAKPMDSLSVSIAYQLIRHGADYGSLQVKGSSIYSELDPQLRGDLQKYFLHDGAYNWIHILSINSSYTSYQAKVPFKVNMTLGGVISYYTGIDSSLYDKTGNSNVNFDTPYSILNNDEYPLRFGPVLTLEVSLGNF